MIKAIEKPSVQKDNKYLNEEEISFLQNQYNKSFNELINDYWYEIKLKNKAFFFIGKCMRSVFIFLKN